MDQDEPAVQVCRSKVTHFRS